MYNFLVLGLIPGTDIQINFQAWLDLLGLMIAGYWIARFYSSRLRFRVVESEIVERHLEHLDASQLHFRILQTAPKIGRKAVAPQVETVARQSIFGRLALLGAQNI